MTEPETGNRPRRAGPFLKWAGGKRQLLPHLLEQAPDAFGTYHEPFVGGGALFFALGPERAVLSDLNERLIRTYAAVRDDVEAVIERLAGYPHEREFFDRLRAAEIDSGSDVDVAAWLIYLNKTAYNGLYRVNRMGRFNAPFGRYENPNICDAEALRACSAALAGSQLHHEDFAAVLGRAAAGDFVYFDPPYAPLSLTANFTNYTHHGFSAHDQVRLRDVARELKARGVRVMLSNSNAEHVRALYADGFTTVEVAATRLINSRADRRGHVTELILR